MSRLRLRYGLRVVVLLSVLSAVASCAAQKTYTKSFSPSAPAVTVFAYDDTIRPKGGSPTYNRLALEAPGAMTALSAIGTNVPYASHLFTVKRDAWYRIACDATGDYEWDNCVYVYAGRFNPAAPLKHCIAGNHAAFGAGHSGIASLHLAPGIYMLVVTSYENEHGVKYAASVAPAANSVNITFQATTDTNARGYTTTWNRPALNLKELSADVKTVQYHAYHFTAPVSGVYHFVSECDPPAAWDIFTFLYDNYFDGTNALSNLIEGHRHFNIGGNFDFSHQLLADHRYVFVTTGRTNGDFGAFTGHISAAGNAPPIYSVSGQAMPPHNTSPTFHRPLISGGGWAKNLDGRADGVPYQEHPFNVAASGLYNFKSVCVQPKAWNNVMILYQGAFDPTMPLDNVVFVVGGNDPATEVIENVPLKAGTQYIWATTCFVNGEGGAFHNTLYTGGQTFPPTIPDNGPGALSLSLRVADNFHVGALDRVVIKGLKHPHAGDLTAMLTHNGKTIVLFLGIGAVKEDDFGSDAAFNGNYTFTMDGADISAAAMGAVISPRIRYTPFLNGAEGNFYLAGDFTTFNGMSAAGDWTLTIRDTEGQFIGAYAGFSLTLTP